MNKISKIIWSLFSGALCLVYKGDANAKITVINKTFVNNYNCNNASYPYTQLISIPQSSMRKTICSSGYYLSKCKTSSGTWSTDIKGNSETCWQDGYYECTQCPQNGTTGNLTTYKSTLNGNYSFCSYTYYADYQTYHNLQEEKAWVDPSAAGKGYQPHYVVNYTFTQYLISWTSITDCYLPKGSYTDDKGTFALSADCKYDDSGSSGSSSAA